MADFYVTTTGSSSGDGSIGNPWNLPTALNQPAAVHSGDTIWLRGGTYLGNYTSYLAGSSGAPIIVRNYPGELATLDGGLSQDSCALTIWGSFVWFWGLDITNSYFERTTTTSNTLRADNIQCICPGSKLINLTVHDGGDGVGTWSTGLTPNNTEVHGCVVYNCGWMGATRGYAHSVYAQNQTGTSTIKNNLLMNSFGNGIQIYGSSEAYTNNFHILNNDIIDPGALNTGGSGVQALIIGDGANISLSPVITGNTIYINHTNDTSGQATMELGYWGAGVSNATFTGNYFYTNNGGITLNNSSGQGITFLDSTGNVLSGYLQGIGEQIGITYDFSIGNTLINGKPTTNSVFVRPNDYEPGRANIVIFNWQQLSSVSVDISSAGLTIGQSFEVVDAQNFYGGSILSNTYTGAPISLPMTLTAVAQPIGDAPKAAVHTGIEYGAFVVLPGATSRHTNYRLKIASAVTGSY